MKAITVWQPWASLIAIGVKPIETRSWSTKHRGRIVIHAGMKDGFMSGPYGRGMWGDADALWRLKVEQVADPGYVWDVEEDAIEVIGTAPLGAVVAAAELVDCLPMVDIDDDCDGTCVVVDGKRAWIDHAGELRLTRIDDQLPLGDFSPGRFAWMLDDIQLTTERCPACWGTGTTADVSRTDPAIERARLLLPCRSCFSHGRCDPIPAKGKQGVWTWEPEAVTQ